MFRLTAVLLACLYAAMSIWGDPPRDDVVVTRAGSFSPALAGLGTAASASADAKDGLVGLSEAEAVEMALAAGEKREEEVLVEEVAATAEPEPEPEQDEGRFVYVTGSGVNLRRGPTTNSAVIGSVSRGDRAEPLSDLSDAWVRIRTEQGVEAWIYGRFLSETPA